MISAEYSHVDSVGPVTRLFFEGKHVNYAETSHVTSKEISHLRSPEVNNVNKVEASQVNQRSVKKGASHQTSIVEVM
jgi:hypothetical protein